MYIQKKSKLRILHLVHRKSLTLSVLKKRQKSKVTVTYASAHFGSAIPYNFSLTCAFASDMQERVYDVRARHLALINT